MTFSIARVSSKKPPFSTDQQEAWLEMWSVEWSPPWTLLPLEEAQELCQCGHENLQLLLAMKNNVLLTLCDSSKVFDLMECDHLPSDSKTLLSLRLQSNSNCILVLPWCFVTLFSSRDSYSCSVERERITSRASIPSVLPRRSPIARSSLAGEENGLLPCREKIPPQLPLN